MNDARTYVFVVLLHVCADIVFAVSLLTMALVATALSREPAQAQAGHRHLVLGMRRWNRFVVGPSLALLWILGLWLAHRAGWFGAAWLHAKLALVLAVSGLHGWLSGTLRRLAGAPPVAPPRMIWITIPAALAAFAAIGWLVLVKPF
jgi:protoporphyrinogen IX oxidase